MAFDNNLLGWLRPADREKLQAAGCEIEVAAGQALYHPGDNVRHVYFPGGPAFLSFQIPFEGGKTVETAMIGREGALGGIVSRGRLPAYAWAVVEHPGTLLRMDVSRLEELKQTSPAIADLFARYADCLLAQIFQSVACAAAHSIEQRAARWLLSAQDRIGGEVVPVTQDRLGDLLGVGRSYVSRVVSALRDGGAIRSGHGRIRIVDRERLDQRSCNCTTLVRAHFDRVLTDVYPDGDQAKQ